MATIIYSGGTFSYVRNHMAICAPAFGNTGKTLSRLIPNSTLFLTKMADSNSNLVTNQDIENHLLEQLKNPNIKCVIMNTALCDFDGQIDDIPSGKTAKRLESREGTKSIDLTPSKKVISRIKEIRPDIIVVGFKTVCNASTEEMDYKAKRMIDTSIDIVLANDTGKKLNALYFSPEAKRAGNTKAPIGDRLHILNVLAKSVTKLIKINQTKEASLAEASNTL